MNTEAPSAPLSHVIASTPILEDWRVDDKGRIQGRAVGAVADLHLKHIDVHASRADTQVCVFRLGRCAEDVT